MYFSFSHPRRYYGAGNRDVLTWKHEKLFHPGSYRSQTNPFVASEEEGRACTERVYYDFMVQSPPPSLLFPYSPFSSISQGRFFPSLSLGIYFVQVCGSNSKQYSPSPLRKKCVPCGMHDYSHSPLRRRCLSASQPDPLT